MVLSCLPWLVLLAWTSWLAWFITDDAFITFRYVRNLLEGHGLVFNPGERVEGYSNFLWALELAAIWKLFGLPPEAVAQWLSVGYTVGVLAVLAWWVRRDAGLAGHRGLAGWMALGLVCGSATFVVWTSGGGLETRQFTFFLMAAMVGLMLHGGSRRALVAVSLCLAGAALTRPEGVLMAACCFGWFGAQRLVAYRSEGGSSYGMGGRRIAAWLDWREVVCLTAPFVLLVGAHLVFRLAYYGEWLPNTYYAKHVRPWYESGFRYYLAAAVETGLYLLVPLAWAAMRQRWRARREVAYALPLLCIFVHMAGVMRVGGDHFEWRPLDFYWPALSVPAVAAILALGARLSGTRWLRGFVQSRGGSGRSGLFASVLPSLLVFVPVFFYASAIQGVLLWEGREGAKPPGTVHVELDEGNARWLLAIPGMSVLVPISNDLRREAIGQSVAWRFPNHRGYAKSRLADYGPMENMERGLIPDDATSVAKGLGILCYYLPDLKFVDLHGLTDATIARNPVTLPNRNRLMAHDRRPPLWYLEERGVNLEVHPAATSKVRALRDADYAVRAGPGLWMPFGSPYHGWVVERFSGRGLAQRTQRPAGVVERAWPAIRTRSQRLAGVIERAQPAIHADFDVYHEDGYLLYAGGECGDEDLPLMFFLHVYPVNENDLPAYRRRFGFDNLDFNFNERRLPRVYFKDVPARSGVGCAAAVELPGYEVARIRTGQYVPKGPRLWDREFAVVRKAP